MNPENLKNMYGSTPESFRQCVEQALQTSPEAASRPRPAPVRRSLRRTLVCALALVLLTAAAYAVFSPRVAEVFGAHYGPAAQERLAAGRSDQPESSIELGGVCYTLHEVTYLDSGLYAVATLRPAEGAELVLLPHDADGPDTLISDAEPLTYGEKAAQTGAKLVFAEISVDQVAVDDGPALSPGSYGVSAQPQTDGSVLYTLEIPAGMAVSQGESYTLHLWVSNWEYGQREETRQGKEWIVTVTPRPAETKGE